MAVQFQQLEDMQLGKFVDIIWDARNAKKTVVAAKGAAPWGGDSPGEGSGRPQRPEEMAWWQGQGWRQAQSQPGGQQGWQRSVCEIPVDRIPATLLSGR